MKSTNILLFIVCLLFFTFARTNGEVILSSGSYERLSGPEHLTPPFNVLGGQTTANTYKGLVEVLVSGVGQDQPGSWSVDAFYRYDNTSNEPLGLYNKSLRLGSERQIDTIPENFTFFPNSSDLSTAASIHVADLAIDYEGDSIPVAPGTYPLTSYGGLAPIYHPDHQYHFVMDMKSYQGTITLGFGDGGLYDNSGAYDIQIWQVQSIPEPSTLALLGMGAISLLSYTRGKR